ncbi:hypothetical protein EDD85DRAFT_961287 [Armillaria nabsnona]|nr:hypothetical protein EDD85DRAFT_961287 [Armillaria nabsnona]
MRPKIDKPSWEKQLVIDCHCGGNMVWKPCPGGPGGKGVHSVLHYWSRGVHYSNGGYHELFEFWLFSESEEAGVAGNQQWGLDVGCHQDNWYPYSTDHDDDYRFGTESEVEPGLHYVYEDGTTHENRMKEPRKWSATREPKDYSEPRPRPILKKCRQI